MKLRHWDQHGGRPCAPYSVQPPSENQPCTLYCICYVHYTLYIVQPPLREGCGKKFRKKSDLLPNRGEGGSQMVVKKQTSILETYFFH